MFQLSIKLHIRIGNLNWCKCRHCKNEAREMDCLCCREVHAMFIASTKIPVREGSTSTSNFYPTAQLLNEVFLKQFRDFRANPKTD